MARAPHFRSYHCLGHLQADWAISKQTTIYRTRSSLQINDPLQVTRQLTVPTRMSGMNILVDPIESEIQVLSSEPVLRFRALVQIGCECRPSAIWRSLHSDSIVLSGSYKDRLGPSAASKQAHASRVLWPRKCGRGQRLPGVVVFECRIWEASPASHPHHSRLIFGPLANSAPKAEIPLRSLSEVRASSPAVRR